MFNNRINRFSLRKTKIFGLASVIIGLAIFGLGTQTVKADTQTPPQNRK